MANRKPLVIINGRKQEIPAVDTAAFTTVTMNAGTLTSVQAIEAATATWNNGTEKFVGRSVDITDTASHTESYLDLLKVAGVRKTGVRKDGALILWNGANDDTNYERGFMRFASNVFEIGTEAAGTGTARSVRLKQASGQLQFDDANGWIARTAASNTMQFAPSSNTAALTLTSSRLSLGSDSANPGVSGNYYFSLSGGATVGVQHTCVIGPSARGGNTGAGHILVLCGGFGSTATTGSAGGDVKVLGGDAKGTGDNAGGSIYIRGGAKTGAGANGYIYLADSTTGGISFFNATPVAQQSGTGETTGFTAGAGTNVTDQSTFTGNVGTTAYRISDVVKALKNYGLLAA